MSRRDGRRTLGPHRYFYEFAQINSITFAISRRSTSSGFGELGERLAINVGRIVLLRINLEVARQLLLLLLARQPGLGDDALARGDRQRVAEQ